jgi:proline iminopeptidase
MSAQEGYIKVTGGNVWYKIVGAKENIPLIMIHGGPGFPSDSLQTLHTLGKSRPVIFYDQLGCGRSDRPKDKSLWKKERFLDELETLRQHLNVDQMHILGHSWGSMIATMYALRYPKRVKSLILSGPFLSVECWIKDANKLKKNYQIKFKKLLIKTKLKVQSIQKSMKKLH